MSDDTKIRISMLERTILDLGTQLFELKGYFEKSKQDHEDLKGALGCLKDYLDKEGLIKKEDFEEELALKNLIENSQIEDELVFKRTKGSYPKNSRRQKH
jgi:hypothetical protein